MSRRDVRKVRQGMGKGMRGRRSNITIAHLVSMMMMEAPVVQTICQKSADVLSRGPRGKKKMFKKFKTEVQVGLLLSSIIECTNESKIYTAQTKYK